MSIDPDEIIDQLKREYPTIVYGQRHVAIINLADRLLENAGEEGVTRTLVQRIIRQAIWDAVKHTEVAV